MSRLIKKKFPSITSIDVGTDGNTSFLRAARNGQLEKVLEHLESNIDINTSNANGLNALHLASKDGHVEIVEELLKRGAVIDAATKKGNTALHIASLAGQEEVVKLLVTHGASVNVQSQNGFTPLYMAAQENHDNVVKYLLANGANQSLSTEDGFTPLAVAMQQGHDKVVTVLLENDTRGKVRLPALHIAAKKDDVKAAKLLLENEHNPDVTSKSGFTPLHIASHYGNQSIANLLVQKGADVNYAAKHNITPLHVAAKWGKTNMVTVLLEEGANIESKTRDGLTPLHCAARSGHQQVVDQLLEKGAPISSKTKNGLAPLHMAAQGDHVDAARILLYHRAPVDEVTVDYLTALHVAAHCGHVRVAKLLLDRQADANARALNGFTPLHIACKKNRIKVVELLLKHDASIGATTESGLTPLHVASFMGCMNIVIYLLQHEANPDVPTVRGETPLHLAARANQTDIIRILLRNGAQVDARAREQQTPLHIASRLGNVDIVMLLLQHGAQVDNTTKDMYTALHIAAKEGQDEVAAALIDNGASLNATTKKGFTPLHLAAKYGHLKVAKLLLQKEAPVDAQGKNGVTPLHVASHYDHQNVALLLLEKGASPYATAKNGHTALHIAAKKNQMDIANTLLEYGAKPNAESKAGFTPLHLSAQEGHCDMTDLLIEHKADPNHNARNGLTPLHLCAQEDKVAVADILVKNGGEVDAATKNGYTPLHIACHYGQINMVRFLLDHGADVKAATSLGYTPLHQAAQQGHTNIVNTLLEHSAQPNAVTNSGQTPLHIAEKLGYITVIDTLKVVTQPSSPISTSTESKYCVVAPEAMHETFMSDSEEEGGEDTVLGDQTYRYLTADEMKSLGDDSLPIDVTRDERIDSNKMAVSAENFLPPRNIEDNISPEHVQQNYIEYIKKYTPDNVDVDKHPISIGFLVSFLVDARGGAMRGCRHSGVRVIVPPRCASSPTRITCRYVRPQRTPHPPPLMEGEALASRVLELGPVGAKFLGPVIIEVPHFAALRGKEREIVILRSDNGENWKEHTIEATEDVLNEVLHDSFEAEDLNQLEDISSGRITRIVTQDFPQYFAVVSRVRQEVHAIGPEGGMVSSTVVPQVQAVFPQGALTKKIKVGLQAQPIDPELTAKLLGHGVAVSPVVTVEPRRRKFHKAITLSMPAPRAHSQGMINQYSGSAPTLRLLCSITGGTTRAQWEDVTGSTPLTFVNDCVSFTTTVSARFWLMDCRNVGDATKMATELYREAIHVPFMAKFVVFAKRVDPLEARLRVFCMTDDKEDKTLEHQEHFTEVAKSRDVEVLEGKPQYIEFAGNLVPITKSGEQLQFSFRAFRENRLPFSVRVKDQHAEAVSRCLFMRESKLPKGEPPQQPICILNIVLPDDIVVDTISLTDSDSVKRIENFDYYRPDPRLADMSNLLGDDWVPLATQLGLTTSEINVIKSEYPDSVAKQAQSMLRMWLSQSGNKAQANTLESALRRIGREDIIPQCLNVDYPPHGIKEIGKQRLIKKLEENIIYEKDTIKESESVESLKKAEEEKKKDNFDKYSAEEKVVETSDEEDFNKTVTERRHQIEERLSVDRTVPASSQRVEIVQEISSIKRQSLVENKIAEVEQKATSEVVGAPKTTITSNELTISPEAENEKVLVDGDRRDSALLEGVTQRFEQKMVKKVISGEDPKSPKVSKTPPPSPADFITREQAASIQDWDVSKKSAPQEEAPLPQDAEQQGLSTTTERLVDSNEETLLDKPLGQQLTGLSVIDDHLETDLKTVCEQTNAFIQSESQPEPYDALAGRYTKKEPVNEKKVDDNKNNMNEKKKAKKGFFGSIKTFVEKSFESDSESEKSPKKSKKPKKEKKKKAKEEATTSEASLPPRKPKLPTPPLEPLDIDNIPFAEASVSDLPPPYKPPDIPIKEEPFPVTDLDADVEFKKVEMKVKPTIPTEKEPEKTPDDKEKIKTKEKPKEKEKKKIKGKTIVVEEVTKTIEPLVIEAEEFSIIVDPTKKESPKKCKETFTVNIDESIEKKEKEILEKSPILAEEKIVKPLAALEMQPEVPIRPPRIRDHVYEDIEEPVVTISQDQVKNITTDLIQNEINFGGWAEAPFQGKVEKEEEPVKEIVEKQDKEPLKEKDTKDVEAKKKEEKKGGFFGLFKKKDSKKEEDAPQKVEKDLKPTISEVVLKNMEDSREFLFGEVQNYHDVRPVVAPETQTITTTVTSEPPEVEEPKTESESFFGFFKKTKKEDKPSIDKKAEPSKKEDEKKVAMILSQEVLKNILDSKQFLEDEIQNYHDVRPEATKKEEKQVAAVEASPKKLEGSPKSLEGKKKASPKKTSDDERESSPKPSPGFFGLFKKAKKEEPDVGESKPIISEETARSMKETDEFLVAEVENYHDVKSLVEEKKLEDIKKEIKEAMEDITEDSKQVAETAGVQSSGFFGLFKKSKKEDDVPLSEATVKDMNDTTQFLHDEVENYHDVRPTAEKATEEKIETETETSSGFFGLFKKVKKEDEKTIPEATKHVVDVVSETKTIEEKPKAQEEKLRKIEERRESSPKPGFLGFFKKSKKDEEEATNIKPPSSDAAIKDINDTSNFLSTEIDDYHDVKLEKFEPVQDKVEDLPKPSKGVFGIFKKSKKDEEESVVKDMEESNQFLSQEVDNYHDVKPEKFEPVSEEKTVKPIEGSPKPSKGVFGIFKRSKTEDEKKLPPTDSFEQDVRNTKEFVSTEIENYHDVKPEKFEAVQEEKVTKAESKGVFGIFKKPKKEDEGSVSSKALSDSVVKDMRDTTEFLSTEIDNYHDVKPEKHEPIQELQATEETSKPSRGVFGIFKKSKKDDEVVQPDLVVSETVEEEMEATKHFLKDELDKYHDADKEAKLDEEGKVESSPKSSRGLFGLFKKQKKDDEVLTDATPVISEAALQAMIDTKSFLIDEVNNYHDVKPEKFESVSEDQVAKTVEDKVESSPKPSRGLFGIFKKSKKDEEEVTEKKPAISPEVLKDMADTDTFLTVEVEHYDDEKPAKEEKIKAEESSEASTKPSKGFFGIFKKSSKEKDEESVEETKQGSEEKEKAPKLSEDAVESSPKSSRGLFGIFKSPKKEKDEVAEPKTSLSEEALKDMADSDRFITGEVENYHDVKIVEETVESKEVSSRPSSGIFGIFKRPKKEEVDVAEITAPLPDTIQKDLDGTKDNLVGEMEKYEDVKTVIAEDVQAAIKTDIQETETRPAVKEGFLAKFKKTKKKPETQLSPETQQSMDETKHFISTELENYEDAKLESAESKKEEKMVTFDSTKSKIVLEGHLPQPEIAQVVEVLKTEVTDVVKDVDENIEVPETILQEAIEVQDVSPKKDKHGKDKKGFFHRFGKKSKSQEKSIEEVRGRSEEESEGSPKKQKRRKSSSPFKFFDKMKKSEEDVKESLPATAGRIEDDIKDETKDDLLTVEFEHQPISDLSQEVLGSLDKKMEEMKGKYPPEVQRQMNDCRDFLFIEVDNYEDTKPVVVTDIDSGISINAGKAVDDIIDKATKVVEESKSQADAAKEEIAESVSKVVEESKSQIKEQIAKGEESSVKVAKKAEKKIGGFFSKLGNLISGGVEETKSEIKEIKKSSDKTKETTEISIDTTVSTVEDGVEQVKKKAQTISDKLDESKHTVEELHGKIAELAHTKDQTAKKVEETKKELSGLKESMLEVSAKVGDILQKDAAKGTQRVTTEIEDAASKSVEGVKKDIKAKGDKAKSTVVTAATEVEKSAKDIKTEIQDTTKIVIDESAKKIDDIKKDASGILKAKAEELDKTKQHLTEVGDKLGDLQKDAAQGTQRAVTEIEDAASKGVEVVRKDVKAKGDKAKSTVETAAAEVQKSSKDIKSEIQDTTKIVINESAKKIEGIKKDASDVLKAKAEELDKTKQHLTEVGDKLGDLQKDAAEGTQKAATEIKDAASKGVEGVRKDVKATGDKAKSTAETAAAEVQQSAKDIKTEIQDTTNIVIDESAKKIEDIKKEAGGILKARAEELDKTKQHVDFAVGKGKETISGTLGSFVTDVGKAKDESIKSITKKVEGAKIDAHSKGQDVVQKLEQVVSAADAAKHDVEVKTKKKVDEAGMYAEDFTSQLERGIQKTKGSVKPKVDSLTDTAHTQASQKAEEIKAAAAQKVEHISDAGKEQVVKLSKVKDTVTDVKENLKEVKDQKVEDLKKIKDEAQSMFATQADDFGKAASHFEDKISQKFDDVKKAKESVEATVSKKASQVKESVAQKAEDVAEIGAKEARAAEDFIAQEIHQAAKTQKDLKTATTSKLDDIAAAAAEKKEKIKDTAAQRIGDATKLASEKIEHLAKAKATVEAKTSQKSEDLFKAASQKIDQVESGVVDVKETAQEKRDNLARLTGSIEEAFASQMGDLIEASGKTKDSVKHATKSQVDVLSREASQATDGFIKAEKFAEESIKQKGDDLARATKTTADQLSKMKDTTSDIAAEKLSKAKSAIDDLSKQASQKVDDTVKAGESAKHKGETAVDDLAKRTKDIGERIAHSMVTTGDDLTEPFAQKTEELAKAKETVKDAATQKVKEVSRATDSLKKKVDSGTKVLKEGVEDLSKVASQKVEATSKSVDKTAKKISDAKADVKDKFEQKCDEVGKAFCKDIIPDLFRTEIKQQKEEQIPSVNGRDKDQKLAELDDQLAKLTSSLEQLAEPIAQQAEKVKSYVTSPTMARRAESQRISREERPTVREVRTVQPDDESDEEHYTVTEPEEAQEAKRKPLFHLESEEDDGMEVAKSKERRDSTRSNVLETLTETKLDNLLTDLENQLVKDLEGSVIEEEAKIEGKLTKEESDLETMKKDSQADVEQIEQKLRDLDKALDSLEQASDPKLEKKLHRVERKFERMASEVLDQGVSGVSPTEVEARRENDFQKLVSQLSTEEVSDFQKEYSHLWDETTFSKSEEWDSKTPDSQVDVQELPQGEESSFATTGAPQESTLKAEGEESAVSTQQTDQSSSQQRPFADQHQLSEEMKQLLKELEKESKQ